MGPTLLIHRYNKTKSHTGAGSTAGRLGVHHVTPGNSGASTGGATDPRLGLAAVGENSCPMGSVNVGREECLDSVKQLLPSDITATPSLSRRALALAVITSGRSGAYEARVDTRARTTIRAYEPRKD